MPKLDDSDRKKAYIGGGILLVALVYIAFSLFHRSPAEGSAMPDGTFWVCKKCDNHFNVSEKALNEHQLKHYGEPLPCPKCGSTELIRSIKCSNCGEYYPMARGGEQKCPKCGTPVNPQAKS